jgi:arylsulfatase A-like enzyme
MRRVLSVSVLALVSCLQFGVVPAAAAQGKGGKRPNIIFILADDLGWTDLGCQGSKYYETPNIDRLAKQGLRFTSHYHSQNCAPTRAALMVGQYAPRTGVYTVGTLERGDAADRKMNVPVNVTNLPLDRRTVADELKAAGYATGMFGKWHLGQKGPYHPRQRGFDEAIVSMGKHFDFVTQPPVDYPKGTYLADWITDRSVDFIERHKNEPFFLYVAHFGVHSPFHAKKELVEKFKDRKAVGGHRDPTYAAMIASIDESVGRILAKLDELGLADDTIVIFASDNGGVGGYLEIGGRGITDNSPLRGGKGMLYEGGVRVPLIVRWMRRMKGGGVCHEPTVHVDLFPTFLELAGVKDRPKQPLDGVSLLPLLTEPSAKLGREAIYFHFPGYLEGSVAGKWRTPPVGFIRAGDWKLMEFFEDGRLELYNLRDDLGERTNLAAKMPDRAKELHGKLAAWRKDLNAAMPQLKEGKKGQASPSPQPGGGKELTYRAGLAKFDITPPGPIWMAGYGNRKKPSEGVDEPLYARVLTLQQGDDAPLVLITADIIGFPRELAEDIAGRLQKEFKLPRENILLVASHTHTGPVIRPNLTGMFDLKDKDEAVLRDYAKFLSARVAAAAAEALAKPEPVRLSFGRGRATFAANRRVFKAGGVNFGVNPDGPVDHEVPVLRVDDAQGKVKAIVFGYACHCTTLGGDHYRLGGDWAGYAQEYLERAHPGATALFVTGCGGDANPEPRGKLDFARQHGLEMAGAVSRVLTGPRTPVTGKLKAVFERVELPLAKLPTREDYQKRLQDKNVFIQKHARYHIDLLDRGEKLRTSYPCPVQVWQLGKDLTLVALGGEVVVDYALRLKRELRDGNLWMAAYANDVFAYVPSTRILIEGGYEADFNLIYYGLPTRFSNDVEEVLVKKVHALVKQVR